MITDWTSMFPPDSDEYWPELQQQIDHWEQRTSDDPGMFNQLVWGRMVAEQRAEAAEAALAAVPRQSIDALFRQQFGTYPVWFNETWTPIADWLGYKPSRR